MHIIHTPFSSSQEHPKLQSARCLKACGATHKGNPMIRLPWPEQRQCLSAASIACFRCGRLVGQTRYIGTLPNGNQEWPLLKRKTRLTDSQPALAPKITELGKTVSAQPTKIDSKNMLLVTGLSSSLHPADFFRLAPKDLSSWQAGIKRVQQRRSRATLEPTGTYQITFEHDGHARSYADNLARLHRLSRHRYSSPSGLWEATVPPHLVIGEGSDNDSSNGIGIGSSTRSNTSPSLPAEELSLYAIAPPSMSVLSTNRVRTSEGRWAATLAEVVEPIGYGPKPPVILLRIFPPGLPPLLLDRIIKVNAEKREMRWRVSKALVWKPQSGSAPQKEDTGSGVYFTRKHEDLTYILAAESIWDAWGFHRYWNQHVVDIKDKYGVEQRYIVKTSIVEM